MAAVTNFVGLTICRFLLGAFEADFFPGVVYFMSLWYPRKMQAVRLSVFWSFSALAGTFGGLIAYGIGQIKSSQVAHWQLIFIIEGFPTILMAVCCWFLLPDSPEQARFLSAEQRQLEIELIAEDSGASHNHLFSWLQVKSIFTDWKTYTYGIIYLTGSIAVQGVTLFLPSVIVGSGKWTPVQSQLMTRPPYVVAFIITILLSRSSD
ncbi:unnamed protein product [Adineta ricciae]|uniref:Major facilitator superfamily (MFS) profile domain-containing protein n=1 Tax=Adineta ricciae TaxID=249248 RepID=A0A815NQT6_ADIRI|nr:unnamed protein product [Adineta ricciae]CAF1437794.1 unnamed protein product [Adineta ricciae]